MYSLGFLLYNFTHNKAGQSTHKLFLPPQICRFRDTNCPDHNVAARRPKYCTLLVYEYTFRITLHKRVTKYSITRISWPQPPSNVYIHLFGYPNNSIQNDYRNWQNLLRALIILRQTYIHIEMREIVCVLHRSIL